MPLPRIAYLMEKTRISSVSSVCWRFFDVVQLDERARKLQDSSELATPRACALREMGIVVLIGTERARFHIRAAKAHYPVDPKNTASAIPLHALNTCRSGPMTPAPPRPASREIPSEPPRHAQLAARVARALDTRRLPPSCAAERSRRSRRRHSVSIAALISPKYSV
eukprot:IDg19631t1